MTSARVARFPVGSPAGSLRRHPIPGRGALAVSARRATTHSANVVGRCCSTLRPLSGTVPTPWHGSPIREGVLAQACGRTICATLSDW